MRASNIEMLESQRPRVELFFKTGSLVLSALTMNATPCEKCIDIDSLVQVMSSEFEADAYLDPYAEWDDETGYKAFLSRLYAHYDIWKEENIKK